MDLKSLFGSSKGPMHTYTKWFELLWSKGGTAKFFMHRNEELVAEEVSSGSNGTKM